MFRSRVVSSEYSYRLVAGPGKCASGCGTLVTNRLAGHYYLQPLCDACFHDAAPELAGAIVALQPVTSVRELDASSAATCANCGDCISGRLAGHHMGDPMCVACFREHAPVLAALLYLEEAVREAAAADRYAEQLLAGAVWYARLVDIIDPEDS